MEQISNAMSIQKLALGIIMDNLDQNILSDWLSNSKEIKINYSNSILIKGRGVSDLSSKFKTAAFRFW